MISKTGEYALRAVLRLADQDPGETLRANEIARELGIPSNYLSKILHSLARAGVLHSERGPQGGFRLAHASDELLLADVVAPVDPAILDQRCLLGRPQCSEENACAVHDQWKRVREPLLRFFAETSVADVQVGGDSGFAAGMCEGRSDR